VCIYETNKSEDWKQWKLTHTLRKHAQFVSGIDWSPVTDQIVTCGHDRNAYVWKFDTKDKDWKPTLVILRINRAATQVKWCPAGNKFAVASGAKCVPVCHFEKSNDWWISKMIKKHKSTVLSLAWCPNNKFIITGSCDMKARVFSAYIKGVDPSEDDGFGEVWADQHKFGEILCEFEHSKAWVNSVAWSPNGFRLAFTGQGSSVHFVQILAGAAPVVQTLELDSLPFLDMDFIDEGTVIAAGFSMNPTIFKAGGDDSDPKWDVADYLDKKSDGASGGAEAKPAGGVFDKSRKVFADSVSRGIKIGADGKTMEIMTKHKNYITCVQLFGKGGTVKRMTTSGLDGRVLFWNV
jgi:actin related protein 2/3 complex subunit 1A/1B